MSISHSEPSGSPLRIRRAHAPPTNKNPGAEAGALLACEASGPSSAGSGLLWLGQYAHVQALLGPLLLKPHLARHLREQGVVGADPDVRARAHLRAALAHDDVAGQHLLAAEALHSQPFGVGVAPVLGAAACLFMCHASTRPDVRDLHFGIELAVV